MHSATKFIAGHSDVMAGVLAVKGEKCVSSSTSLIPLSSVFEIPSYYICQQISRLAKELYFLQNSEGSGLAPFDCWICLRGIKTMALRIEKQQVNGVFYFSLLCWFHYLHQLRKKYIQENARKIAMYLSSHPRVKKVYYAGLPDHPGHHLHFSQVTNVQKEIENLCS